MENKENVLSPLSEYNEETYGDIKENAVENGRIIKEAFKGSFDIVVKKGYCNGKCVVFANCDGLCSAQRIADNAIKPLLTFQGELPEENVIDFIGNHIIYGTEQKQITSLDEAMKEILRGTLLIFVEGEKTCIVFGVQNPPQRALQEPDNEVQEFGAREGFVENIKTNLKLPSKEVTYLRYILDSRYIPVSGELIKNKRNDWRVKITIHDH